MNWKNRTITYSGLMAAVALAFTYNIPPWDKPAALVLHEHAARYFRDNKIKIIALRNEVQLRDVIKSVEWNVLMLESNRIKILESNRLSDNEKASELQRIKDKLNRQNKKLDRYEEELEQINGLWDGYMLAKQP